MELFRLALNWNHLTSWAHVLILRLFLPVCSVKVCSSTAFLLVLSDGMDRTRRMVSAKDHNSLLSLFLRLFFCFISIFPVCVFPHISHCVNYDYLAARVMTSS